jgi:hypothetical protein
MAKRTGENNAGTPSKKTTRCALLHEGSDSVPGDSVQWTIEKWLQSLRSSFPELLACELMKRKPDETSERDFLSGGLQEEALAAALQSCLQPLSKRLWTGIQELSMNAAPGELSQPVQEQTAKELNAKFRAATFEMSMEEVAAQHLGLAGKLGLPDPNVRKAMEWEHNGGPAADVEFTYGPNGDEFTTTAKKEWSLAVNGCGNDEAHRQDSCPACGNRAQVRSVHAIMAESPDKWSSDGGKIKKLTEEEVIAGILYTGPMYLWYGNILRYPTAEQVPPRISFLFQFAKLEKGKSLKDCFVTTTHAISSCVTILAREQPAIKVYRGLAGGVLPEQFWKADAFNVKGGVDSGFLSFTATRAKAMNWALKGDSSHLVLEASMGMIDRGASMEWLTQYPGTAARMPPPLKPIAFDSAPSFLQVKTRFYFHH